MLTANSLPDIIDNDSNAWQTKHGIGNNLSSTIVSTNISIFKETFERNYSTCFLSVKNYFAINSGMCSTYLYHL